VNDQGSHAGITIVALVTDCIAGTRIVPVEVGWTTGAAVSTRRFPDAGT
jgi:hypothetical protein